MVAADRRDCLPELPLQAVEEQNLWTWAAGMQAAVVEKLAPVAVAVVVAVVAAVADIAAAVAETQFAETAGTVDSGNWAVEMHLLAAAP